MTTIVIDEKTETGKSLMNIVKVLQKTSRSVSIFPDVEVENFLQGKLMQKKGEKRKPSDFAGTLSKKDSKDLLEYVSQCREEWEKDF